MMGLLALLLRFIPFAGPIGILCGFVPRLLHLKREKAVIAAATQAGIPTEPFPVANQIEIDNHTIRVRMAAWRLAAGVMTASTAFCGLQWWANDGWKEEAEHKAGLALIDAKAARNERDTISQSYTTLKTDYDRLVVLNSEASKNREGLIVAKTKAKVKRAVSDAKIVDAVVDADSWLRIESAGGTASGVPASAVQPTGGLPSGAG